MKTEEITNGNIMLAEFMGHNCDLGAAIRFMYSSSEPFPLSGNDANLESVESEVQMEVEEFGSTLQIETVSFHNSWDWLMPVVERIETEILDGKTSVSIDGDNCYIQSSGFNQGIFGITKIESVFLACIEFIKWYNQNK